MEVESLKEVLFNEWCPKCKDAKTDQNKEPCVDCLGEPVNTNSTKPLYFKEK